MATTSPAAARPADRPLLGVLLIIAFCILAPLGDAMGKLLGAMPLGQLLLARYAIQAGLLLPLVYAGGQIARALAAGLAA